MASYPPAPVIEMRVGTADGWTLNDPTLSRLDAGNVLDGPLDGFVDLSSSAVSVEWSVGSSSANDFATLNPSYARVRFFDPNRDLDPNGTGTYSTKVAYNTPIRIRVNGVQHFYGFLWAASWSLGYTTVTAVDYLSKLAGVTLTATTSQGEGETGAARIARLLANSSVNVTISVGSGTSVTRQATDLAGNVLSNMSAIVETEWGLLYPNDGGTSYTYFPDWYSSRRVALSAWLTSGALSCVAEEGGTGIDVGRIRNVVNVTSPGLTDSSATSSTSVDLYGRRTWSKSSDFYGQAQQDAYASSVVTWYGSPPKTSPTRLRFVFQESNTSSSYDASLMADAFLSGCPLGRYIVMSTAIGWTGTPFVVGANYSYTPTAEWAVTVALADLGGTAVPGYWTLDAGLASYLDFGRVLNT